MSGARDSALRSVKSRSTTAASWRARKNSRVSSPAAAPSLETAKVFDAFHQELRRCPRHLAGRPLAGRHLVGGAVAACVFLPVDEHVVASVLVVMYDLDVAPPPHVPSATGRSQPEVEEYWELHELESSALESRGCVELVVAGADARSRWAADRARCPPADRAQRGAAPGSVESLQRALGRTLVCAVCSGLVHAEAARRQANARGSASFAAGDGCASATCTTSHAQPARYRANQAKMAQALLGRTRKPRELMLWPPAAAPRTDWWRAPPSLARDVALARLASVASSLSASRAAPPRKARAQPRMQSPPGDAGVGPGGLGRRPRLRVPARDNDTVPAVATATAAAAAAVRVGGKYFVTAAPYGLEWLNGLPCVVRAARAGRFDVDVIYTRCGEVERVSLAPSHLRNRLARGEYLATLRLAAPSAIAAASPSVSLSTATHTAAIAASPPSAARTTATPFASLTTDTPSTATATTTPSASLATATPSASLAAAAPSASLAAASPLASLATATPSASLAAATPSASLAAATPSASLAAPSPAIAADTSPPSLTLATATSPPSLTHSTATSPPSPAHAAATSPPSPTHAAATSPPSLTLAATSPSSPALAAAPAVT
jgi:hypothetical protein